jgi:putative ABC transport system permease protein
MAHSHTENLKQAMDTLRAHKMRSALTVFGVVLGVSVIMLVAALITGFDETIQESIKQFGADTAFVSRWDRVPTTTGPTGRSKNACASP